MEEIKDFIEKINNSEKDLETDEIKKMFFDIFSFNGNINIGVFNFIYNDVIKKFVPDNSFIIESKNNLIVISSKDLLSQIFIRIDEKLRTLIINTEHTYIINNKLYKEEKNEQLKDRLTAIAENYYFYNYDEPNVLEADLYLSKNITTFFNEQGILEKKEIVNGDIGQYKESYMDYFYLTNYFMEKLNMIRNISLTGLAIDDESSKILFNDLNEEIDVIKEEVDKLAKNSKKIFGPLKTYFNLVSAETIIYENNIPKETYSVMIRKK